MREEFGQDKILELVMKRKRGQAEAERRAKPERQAVAERKAEAERKLKQTICGEWVEFEQKPGHTERVLCFGISASVGGAQ